MAKSEEPLTTFADLLRELSRPETEEEKTKKLNALHHDNAKAQKALKERAARERLERMFAVSKTVEAMFGRKAASEVFDTLKRVLKGVPLFPAKKKDTSE